MKEKGENFEKSLFFLQEVNYSLGQTGVGIPMNLDRHTQFLMRKEKILSVAEKLLLENNQEITLDELVAELDIAKGTLYKHFRSKMNFCLN